MKSDRLMTPTAEQYAAFERLFDALNKELFGGALEQPMLVFARTRTAAAHYIPRAWKRAAAAAEVDEIALNPEYLADDHMEIAQSLVHEMCHQYQHAFGRPPRAGYHDKEFARIMRERGLEPVAMTRGVANGKDTGQSMSDRPIPGAPFERFFETRGLELVLPLTCVTTQAERRRPDQSKTPYRAESGLTVWAKPGLVLMDLESGEILAAEHGDPLDDVDDLAGADDPRMPLVARAAALLPQLDEEQLRSVLAFIDDL